MRLASVIVCLILFAAASSARTWHVEPDGSGDAPTIQAGIDSALAGDTIEVAAGVYGDCAHPTPDGGSACAVLKPGVCLRSAAGDPASAIIDAGGLGRALYCENVGDGVVIEGFTITGGYTAAGWPDGQGGGLICRDGSAPSVRNCRFVGNRTTFDGGAVSCCWNSSARFTNVVFEENTASHSGGGLICCHLSHATLTDCEFLSNSAVYGGGLYAGSGSDVVLTRVLFRENTGSEGGGADCNDCAPEFLECAFARNHGAAVATVNGAAVRIERCVLSRGHGPSIRRIAGGGVSIACADIWGNEGGDWIDWFSHLLGADGNFSADPLFCDIDGGDFRLRAGSPCLPGNHPDGADCGTVGPFGEGCAGPAAATRTGWGTVKRMFR